MVEISNIVGTSIGDFINYALVIVTLMIIYYIFKFFLVGPPSKEEKEQELAAQRQAWGEKFESAKKWKKEREAEQKQKKEKERKRLNVSPIKENLVEAIEAADKVLAQLGKAKTEHDRSEILDLIHRFNKEMDRAGRNFRILRRKLEGAERNFITERITELEVIQENVNNCKKKLPKMSPAFWQQVQSIGLPKTVKDVRLLCHNLWNEIEKFHQ